MAVAFAEFAWRGMPLRRFAPPTALRYSFSHVRELHCHRPLDEEAGALRLSMPDRGHLDAARRRGGLQVFGRRTWRVGRAAASRLGRISQTNRQDDYRLAGCRDCRTLFEVGTGIRRRCWARDVFADRGRNAEAS